MAALRVSRRAWALGAIVTAAAGCGHAVVSTTSNGEAGSSFPSDGGNVASGPADGGAATGGKGILAGYYASWARSALPPSAIVWGSLTHVVEAFALPEPDGGISNLSGFADDALVLAAHAQKVKVVASVGGASGDFASSAVDPSQRARTVAALVSLCAERGYDGIDVDWEFPDATTIGSWVSFLDELRAALDAVRPGLSLSSTIAPTSSNGDLLPAASLNRLDWIAVMAYRYSGPTSDEVGYMAPLAEPSDAGEGSVAETIHHLISDRGLDPSRLLLGLAFYGYEFQDGPPGAPVAAPSHVVEWDDSKTLPLVGTPGWSRAWDTTASVPYLSNGQSFVTYEDETSIDAKCRFAHDNALAGAMIWHMAQGRLPDGSQPLMAHAAGCR